MEDYSSVIWHKFIRLFDCKSTSFFRYTQIFRDFLQKTWFLFVVRRRFTRKKLQENALCLHSRCYTLSSKMRKFCDYFLILTYFFTFPAYKITTYPLTHQIIPHIFYIHLLFFVLNQPSSTKKGGPPPLIILSCPLMLRAAFFWAKTKE